MGVYIMHYDYKMCVRDIKLLTRNNDFIEKIKIGYSNMNKPIYCVKIGKGERNILVTCAHFGTEYLTSAFIMNFLKNYADAYKNGDDFEGKNSGELYSNISLYVIPMLNPDSVDIAVNGFDITDSFHQRLISDAGVHSFNRVWKDSLSSSDIHHEAGLRITKEYSGEKKCRNVYFENEVVKNFNHEIDFDMFIRIHSHTEDMYYDFGGASDNIIFYKDKKFGQGISETAGFAVEIRNGEKQPSVEMLCKIYDDNAAVLVDTIEELYKKTECGRCILKSL